MDLLALAPGAGAGAGAGAERVEGQLRLMHQAMACPAQHGP